LLIQGYWLTLVVHHWLIISDKTIFLLTVIAAHSTDQPWHNAGHWYVARNVSQKVIVSPALDALAHIPSLVPPELA